MRLKRKEKDFNFDYDLNFEDEEPKPKNPLKKIILKITLYIIGILLILALSIGAYEFVTNKDKFLSYFNLSTDENGKIVFNTRKNNESEETNNTILVPNSISPTSSKIDDEILTYENFSSDDKGLTFDIQVKNNSQTTDYTINCEKILVDGFDTTSSFEVFSPADIEKKITVTINKSELDALGIYCINTLTFYYTINSNEYTTDKSSDIIRSFTIKLYNDYTIDNSITGGISLGTYNNVEIRYLRMEEDAEYTYVYFDVKNSDSSFNKTLKVKKILVNDEIFKYKELNSTDTNWSEDIYRNAEKIIYLEISKEKVPDVTSITVSFFVISSQDSYPDSVYVTNEFTTKA